MVFILHTEQLPVLATDMIEQHLVSGQSQQQNMASLSPLQLHLAPEVRPIKTIHPTVATEYLNSGSI